MKRSPPGSCVIAGHSAARVPSEVRSRIDAAVEAQLDSWSRSRSVSAKPDPVDAFEYTVLRRFSATRRVV